MMAIQVSTWVKNVNIRLSVPCLFRVTLVAYICPPSTFPGRAPEIYHIPMGSANPERKACYNTPQLTIGSAGS